MIPRRFGILLSWLALTAACSTLSPGKGRDPDKTTSPDDPAWSLPGSGNGWSADESSATPPRDGTSSGAGPEGPIAGGGEVELCSWGEPTLIHLTVPSWRTLSSAPLARALTAAKKLPDPGRVRAEDFLNYYPIKYDPAATETDFGFHAGAAPGTLPNELVLQIAMAAPAKFDRPKVALAVVVDTSLSMAGAPWKRAKAAVIALAKGLKAGDTLTLVTAKRGPKSAEGPEAATALANALSLDAGEDLAGALEDAYQSVSDTLPAGGVGRVVLISDGAAQPTSIELGVVASNFAQGVPLIGVGVGDAPSYQGDFLGAATANGGGANLYVDSEAEATAVLQGRFDELMFTVASDVEVIVTLPPSLRFEALQTSIKAESPTGLATAKLAAGRTLVIRNVLETCQPSIKSVVNESISVVVRYRPVGSDVFLDSPEAGGPIGKLLGVDQPQIRKASVIAAYADAVANVRLAMLERAAEMLAEARLAEASLLNDPELNEIEGLIQADLEIASAAAASK